MTASRADLETALSALEPVAFGIVFAADSLPLAIDDGRELSVPLAWSPRRPHALKPWLARTL